MKITSNKNEIIKSYYKAFRATANALAEANKEAIKEPSHWAGFEGRTTYRQSGEVVVGAYRNIFDLGNVYFGQSISIDNSKAILSWDGNGETPVIDVYFGKRSSSDFIPGRPWVDLALTKVDLPSIFKENF